MDRNRLLPVPKATLLLAGLCALCVLAFLLLVIVPLNRDLAENQRTIARIQRQIAEQKVLFPVFGRLFASLKSLRREDTGGLALPAAAKFSRTELDALQPIVEKLCRDNALVLRSCRPDPTSLNQQASALAYNLQVQGPFANLGAFVRQMIGHLGFVQKIEQLALTRAPEGGQLICDLKLWLAIQ